MDKFGNNWQNWHERDKIAITPKKERIIMLNLAKLAGKTPKISRHFKQEVTASRKRVFATNGSKIAPSHREIAYFYLINVGRIVLH